MQTKTTSYLARAAMTLLLATLSSTGAWADKTYTAGESFTSVTWGTETVIVQGSGNVTFSSRITISGSTTLKVASGTTLVAEGGIYVGNGNTLTIEGGGTINATGKNSDAAIGGIYYTNPTCGTIIINGCTITANGGTNAAGIGCADQGTGGSVTINGGTVTAKGSGSDTGGAGIGSGQYGSFGNITINGGIVTATPCPYAAGIGGGRYGGCGTINIYGGIVTCNNTGGYAYYSFGPGKDYDGNSGTCTVTFGWTNSTDKIDGCQVSSNNNTLVFVKGKHFINSNNSVVETASNSFYNSTFTLTPRIVDAEHDIANATLTGHSTYTETNCVYNNGSDIPYGVEIDGTALTASTNYTVDKLTCNGTAVTALKEKGDYELTILGTGAYCGIKTFQFTVNDEVILSSSNKVTSWVDGTTYIASTYVPMKDAGDITVTGNVHLLILGNEGSPLFTSSINVSAGNTLTISGNGYLTIDVEGEKASLGAYSGNCGTIIINGGNINCNWSSGTESLIGSNNTNAGTVEINGGVIQARQIRCKDIKYNGGQVTLSKTNTGAYGYIACTNLTLGWTDAQNDFIQAIGYSPTNLAFVPGKAFMVDGEYTTVTASNINSLGSKKLVPKRIDMSKDIAYAIISGINATYEYTGSAIDISDYTVTDTKDNTLLRDFDYTAALTLGGTAVSEVKDAGDYVLTVTGQNGYTGEKSVNFTVAVSAPSNLKQTAYTATSATLSWTESSTPTNWTLEYSTDNTFPTGVTTIVNVTSNPVTLTDLAEDATYYARVKIVSGSVESDWSNTAEFVTTAKRWIGYDKDDGETNYVILNSYYKYNISEQIYLQSEIGGAGVIRSIDFFVTKNGGQTRNIDIYMVHTPNNYFNSNKAWINPTSTNLVFSGNVTFANGWNTITLTTPFEYDGNQNLAVIVNDITGNSSVNANDYALYFRTLNDNDNMCISGLSATPYDPSTISTTGSQRKIKNEIRLGIDESVSVAMNADGIRTYASPFALDLSSVNAYVVSDFNGTNSTLTLTKVNEAPANTGLMIKTADDSQKGQSIDLPILSSADAVGKNWLKPVLSDETVVDQTEGSYTNFVLANGVNGINWYILKPVGEGNDGKIGAHKAYLQLPTAGIGGTTTSRSFTWVYEDATGINDVQRSTPTVERDTWFSLDGVKLNGKPTTKGLYINNGKKVVVR
jgi:hypothetical protein